MSMLRSQVSTPFGSSTFYFQSFSDSSRHMEQYCAANLWLFNLTKNLLMRSLEAHLFILEHPGRIFFVIIIYVVWSSILIHSNFGCHCFLLIVMLCLTVQ